MAIIRSLLDLDFYKLTMGQFVFHRYPGILVTYGFNNRTLSVPIAAHIPIERLMEELAHVQTLRYKMDELEYLASLKRSDGTQTFGNDYLDYLSKLVPGEFSLKYREDGQIDLSFTGPWENSIYWETFALSIINELYDEYKVSDMPSAHAEGDRRLAAKIEMLRKYPQARIVEFGTRRRFSGSWQKHVTTRLSRELLPGQLVGTSNVLLAKELGLRPIGTMAHELFMVLAALKDRDDESLLSSHNLVIREWWDEYGEDLSVALTDTFGTDFFFRDLTAEQARAWRGLRQDSGDPLEFGEKARAFYAGLGIDTRTKQFVASDGLDIDMIVAILERFSDVFQVSFGWGTDLTNDLGIAPLSMVIKAVGVNGHGTVKLSDNLAKATGNPDDVQRYKLVFGYTATDFVPTRY